MPTLPTGTITFLFTDIEGSTPLWERMPQAMQASVALHHAILREEIEDHGGTIFQIFAAVRKLQEGAAAKAGISPAGEADFARNLAIAKGQVDEAAFQAAWAEGWAMTFEQAMACALNE